MENIHFYYVQDRTEILENVLENIMPDEECIAKLSDGTTLLHHATRNRDVEMVSALLKRLPVSEFADMWGIDPITIAAARGYTEIVELFLDNGYKVDYANYNLTSPLGCAIQNEHADIVKLILSRRLLGKIDSKIFIDVAETGNIELFDIVYSYMPISERKAIVQPIVAGKGITIAKGNDVVVQQRYGNLIGGQVNVIRSVTAGGGVTITSSTEMTHESYSLLDIVLHLAKFHTFKHANLLAHIISKCNIHFNMRIVTNALHERASVEYFKAIFRRYKDDAYQNRYKLPFHSLLLYLRHNEQDFTPAEHQYFKDVFDLFCVVGCYLGGAGGLGSDLATRDFCDLCGGCSRFYIKVLLLSGYISISSRYNPLIREVADEITLFDKCYYKLEIDEKLK